MYCRLGPSQRTYGVWVWSARFSIQALLIGDREPWFGLVHDHVPAQPSEGMFGLPETVDELCEWLLPSVPASKGRHRVAGERATERNLKALSRQGKLARYKVLHFATQGVLAGESS